MTRTAFGSFLAAFPGYPHTGTIDELRKREYPALNDGKTIYLDYTGSGVAADSQIRFHAQRIAEFCYGNPHSENPASTASTDLVDAARAAVLDYLRADHDEYAAIFTANASAGCRLVGEAYPFGLRRPFVLTFDNHNSVNGIRQFAHARRGRVHYVPVAMPDLRVHDEDRLRRTLARSGRGLFAFPAQSNFSGVQHPLAWVDLAHEYGYDVLLDAAAYVPTNRLDLSVIKPDFVPVSWYKLFGHPTGVGCLVARREALTKLQRPWFAGGTILAVAVQGNWFRFAPDETKFEDGTLNFLSIPDINFGLSWIEDIGIDLIHDRVEYLTGWLLREMTRMRHSNGSPMVLIYGPADTRARGGTVAFNLLDPHGQVVDERLIARETAAAGLAIRTGCFCNPGAGEAAFKIRRRRVLGAIAHGDRTVDEYINMMHVPSGGAIRASLGLVSTFHDVQFLLDFIEATYRDRMPDPTGLAPRLRC